MTNEQIKAKTLEIYSSLPQTYDERLTKIEARNEIIELNYSFFNFAVQRCAITNTSIAYEDKVQTAILGFCQIWWQYMFHGDEKHRGYRSDLAFSTFFKPRISEIVERELNTIKYNLYRTLTMKAGNELGKPWTKVNYDDLHLLKTLAPDEIQSLAAIFGIPFSVDLDTYATYEPGKEDTTSDSSKYLLTHFNKDNLVELLIQEMVASEAPLTRDDLKHMAEIYDVSFRRLEASLPDALDLLHRRIEKNLE
jgi:hypothetical protein